MKPTVVSADVLFEDHRGTLRWEWVAGLGASERRFDEVAIQNAVVSDSRWTATFDPTRMWRIKDIDELDDNSLRALAKLYVWRHEVAAIEDQPAGRLVNDEVLPRSVTQMISAGEESGKLGEVLDEISVYYARQLKDNIKAVTSMIEPIMILMMGTVVGFIAMAIILPIFKMSQIVK